MNGQALYFDQPPMMDNGTVLVPIRTIFEVVGADVQWVATTIMVTKGDLAISMPLSHKQATINGVRI
ncbi:stalk domain-containing protein [Virgibacillus sp. SK37]|uniref:stalk domain-containing protein n=1 Tax=Virgibacillus sp. SK37 TaxID=403957 RepID=UPI00352D7BED